MEKPMAQKPVTSAELRAIIGELDGDLASAIIGTGASAAEVAEAEAWRTMDDALGKELHHRGQGRVAQVYELLAAGLESWDER